MKKWICKVIGAANIIKVRKTKVLFEFYWTIGAKDLEPYERIWAWIPIRDIKKKYRPLLAENVIAYLMGNKEIVIPRRTWTAKEIKEVEKEAEDLYNALNYVESE